MSISLTSKDPDSYSINPILLINTYMLKNKRFQKKTTAFLQCPRKFQKIQLLNTSPSLSRKKKWNFMRRNTRCLNFKTPIPWLITSRGTAGWCRNKKGWNFLWKQEKKFLSLCLFQNILFTDLNCDDHTIPNIFYLIYSILSILFCYTYF